MKKLLALLALTAGTALAYAETHAPAQPSPATFDSSWTAKAKASYPLKTCVVSGEDLGGDMGEAIDYVYHQKGQPDRLVRFCCDKCVKKFEKNPEKYLKEIDEAAAKAEQR